MKCFCVVQAHEDVHQDTVELREMEKAIAVSRVDMVRRVRQVKKHAEEKVGWTLRGVRFCVEVGAATLMDTMAVMEEEQKKKAKVPVNLFCKFCS